MDCDAQQNVTEFAPLPLFKGNAIDFTKHSALKIFQMRRAICWSTDFEIWTIGICHVW